MLVSSGRKAQERRSEELETPLATGPIAVRACALAFAVILGGCSASEIVQNLPPSSVSDLPQPDYRRIVADNIKVIFPGQTATGDLEISGVRLVAKSGGRRDFRRESTGSRRRPYNPRS